LNRHSQLARIFRIARRGAGNSGYILEPYQEPGLSDLLLEGGMAILVAAVVGVLWRTAKPVAMSIIFLIIFRVICPCGGMLIEG